MKEKGRERRNRGVGEGEERDFRVVFWNMARLRNKNREFCNGLRDVT